MKRPKEKSPPADVMKRRLQKSKKPKDNQARNMKSKDPINTLAVRS